MQAKISSGRLGSGKYRLMSLECEGDSESDDCDCGNSDTLEVAMSSCLLVKLICLNFEVKNNKKSHTFLKLVTTLLTFEFTTNQECCHHKILIHQL